MEGLPEEIDELVKSCKSCQAVKSSPAACTPLHPWTWPSKSWTWPSKSWQCIHIDFGGLFLGSMFLIVVDAHSKWSEMYPMSTTTAEKTIEVLRHIFVSYGLPLHVVTDNGPQFTAEEFAMFLRNNGVKHICTIPYHLASNGLA